MIATLPMYDLPALQSATDAWWQGLARHMRAAGIEQVPVELARERGPAWSDGDLLFSQTCGYPLTHALAGIVEPVCTPVYAARGCSGGRYSSALVVADDAAATTLADLRGGVAACNGRDSHSGYNVLRRMVAEHAGGERFFAEVLETGAHVASLRAVAERRADVCAVDAVTHSLCAHWEPERLAGTRVLAFSPAAPALPYVAGRGVTAAVRERMRAAVHAAAADPALAATRAALQIVDVCDLPRAAYDEIPAMEREAQRLGYPELQ